VCVGNRAAPRRWRICRRESQAPPPPPPGSPAPAPRPRHGSRPGSSGLFTVGNVVQNPAEPPRDPPSSWDPRCGALLKAEGPGGDRGGTGQAWGKAPWPEEPSRLGPPARTQPRGRPLAGAGTAGVGTCTPWLPRPRDGMARAGPAVPGHRTGDVQPRGLAAGRGGSQHRAPADHPWRDTTCPWARPGQRQKQADACPRPTGRPRGGATGGPPGEA